MPPESDMIEGNMAAIVFHVDNYLHYFPQYSFLRDDLTSAGFMGLVKAVNSMAEEGFRRGRAGRLHQSLGGPRTWRTGRGDGNLDPPFRENAAIGDSQGRAITMPPACGTPPDILARDGGENRRRPTTCVT